ncbi:MAG: T9SS type A sorting domain-containing protein [Cyclobacteriaceae bacterium]
MKMLTVILKSSHSLRIAPLTFVGLLIAAFCSTDAFATKDYNWDGDNASNQWNIAENWDNGNTAPGDGNDPGTYSIDATDGGVTPPLTADITSATFAPGDGNTNTYGMSQLGVIGDQATLNITGDKLSVTSDEGVVGVREGATIAIDGGDLDAVALSVLDDGSNFSLENGTVSITKVVAIGADPNDPIGEDTGGSPTITVGSGGILDCDSLIFDDEEGHTPLLIIESGGEINITDHMVTTDGGNDGTPLIEGIGNVNISGSTSTLNVDGDLIFDNNGDTGTYGNDQYFMSDGAVIVLGDFTVNGDFEMTGGTLYVGGDFDISGGTNSITGGTIILDGGSAQQMSVTAGTSFNNLTIDNSAGVTVSQNITITGVLTLTSGELDMDNNTLTISNTATGALTGSGTIASETSIINRSVTSGNSYTFPFAYGASIPFIFNMTGGGPGTVQVETVNYSSSSGPFPFNIGNLNKRKGLPPNQYNVDNSMNTVDRFWNITVTGGPTATITFNATTGETAGITGLQAQRWNGTSWDAPMDGATNVVAGVSSFSPWTMSGNGEALPVELLFFDASTDEEDVWLEWATATEIDNEKFEIERSLDGITFSKIAEVEGHGDSKERIDYSYLDAEAASGTNEQLYYRLKQIDYDGAFEYSEINLVTVKLKQHKLSVVPNPYSSTFDLKFTAGREESARVRVVDMNGKIYYSSDHLVQRGANSVSITNLYDIPSGIYLVNIQGPSVSFTERLLKR